MAIIIDVSFEDGPQRHLVSHGVITKNPISISSIGVEPWQMPWETTIETQEGDMVWFNYMQTLLSFKKGNYYKGPNGELYILVKYSELSVAKRGDEVIPLNGYCLLEPIGSSLNNRAESIGLVLPEAAKGQVDNRKAVVAYVGTPNKRYLNSIYKDAKGLKIGDEVLMDKNCTVPLEASEHATFDGGKKYFKVMLRDIMGRV